MQSSRTPVNDAGSSRQRLIGESPAFLSTMDRVSDIAPLEKPILVVGERGTGKEGVAERIHYLSGRWQGTFLKLNCAAISETLLESELFGHEAGAFTGATRAHQGRFERADGGTLFLDELAAASLLVQEKILRVIEYGEFERLGGSRTLTANIRLIAATNEDLPTLARQGRFREDLLDRLAFDVITLPPLRCRQEDIPVLARHFAVRMASELGRELFTGFSDRALEQLLDHPWPGNIRELKNVVERAVYRSADPDAEVDEITFDPFDSPWRPPRNPHHAIPEWDIQKTLQKTSAQAAAASKRPNLPLDFREHIQDYEIDLLQHALEESQFNQKRTAEQLGLTYHQLRGYLRKYPLLNRSE